MIFAGSLDNVGQGSRAELENDVDEVIFDFSEEVPNNVRMIIYFLEDLDFSRGKSSKLQGELFDCNDSVLEGAFVNNGIMRASTYSMRIDQCTRKIITLWTHQEDLLTRPTTAQ